MKPSSNSCILWLQLLLEGFISNIFYLLWGGVFIMFGTLYL